MPMPFSHFFDWARRASSVALFCLLGMAAVAWPRASFAFFERHTSENQLPADVVTALEQDWDGKVWVGTEHGVAVYYNSYWEQFGGREDYSRSKITSLLFDPSKSLIWAGAVDGLKMYDMAADRWSAFDAADGLPNAHVTKLLMTKESGLWVGTKNGLAHYDGKRFESFQKADDTGFTGDEILDLTIDAKGRLWAAADSGLLVLEKIDQTRFWRTVPFPPDLIGTSLTSILADEADGEAFLWVGTRDGLQIYYPDREESQWVNPMQGVWGLPAIEREITAFYLDKENRTIWVGSNGAIWAIREGTRSFYKRGVGRVESIVPDKQGRIWIASREGLFRIYLTGEGPRSESVSDNSPFEAFHFHNILIGQANEIWVGTQAGLLHASLDWDLFPTPGRIDLIGPDLNAPGRVWAFNREDGFYFLENEAFAPARKLEGPPAIDKTGDNPQGRRMDLKKFVVASGESEDAHIVWALANIEDAPEQGVILAAKSGPHSWRTVVSTGDGQCKGTEILDFAPVSFDLKTFDYEALVLTDMGFCRAWKNGKREFTDRGISGERLVKMAAARDGHYRALTESNEIYLYQPDQQRFVQDISFTLPLKIADIASSGESLSVLMKDPVNANPNSNFAAFLGEGDAPGALRIVGIPECGERYFKSVYVLKDDWWLIGQSGAVCSRQANNAPKGWQYFTPFNGLPSSDNLKAEKLVIQPGTAGYEVWALFPERSGSPGALMRHRTESKQQEPPPNQPQAASNRPGGPAGRTNIWIVIAGIGWSAALLMFFTFLKRSKNDAARQAAAEHEMRPAAAGTPKQKEEDRTAAEDFDIPGFAKQLQAKGDIETLRELPRLIYNIPHAMGHDFALPRDIAVELAKGSLEKETLAEYVEGEAEDIENAGAPIITYRPGNLNSLVKKYEMTHASFLEKTKQMTGFPLSPFPPGMLRDLESLFRQALEEFDSPAFREYAGKAIPNLLANLKEKKTLAVDRFLRRCCVFDVRRVIFEAVRIQYPLLTKHRFRVDLEAGGKTLALFENGMEINMGKFEEACASEMSYYKIPLLRDRMVEALNDIFQNAIEASADAPEKWIRISLDARDLDKIKIRIADRGKGIPSSALEEIFKEGVSIGKDGSNMGRGLYSARQIIIRDHHGEIRAKSDGDGQGAEFIVSLPT